ncbi:MAG: hypothetical protein IAG13_17180, partial [Deltaproteobacteria bacterium]|nr:hypothetical protein [Nannocystaceae bacterium]
SWLRVRSDERRGDLVLTRHSGDMVERPVGWFRSALDDDALAKLQDAITSTKWNDLPPPQIGDPTANMLRLSYADGTTKVEREFSVTAQAFIAEITPVMAQIQASMSAPLATPYAAVAVTAEVSPVAAGRVLRMRLRNVGSQPIVITDPRVASAAGPRAQLMVAAAPGPMGMPAWTSVPLPPLPKGAASVRLLAAGEELEVETTWRPTLRGACLLQAIWSDYAGPVRAIEGQRPWLPVPAEGPIPGSGPYPVRGAAFSSYAAFDA